MSTKVEQEPSSGADASSAAPLQATPLICATSSPNTAIATVLRAPELGASTRRGAIPTVLHCLALDPRPLLRAELSMFDGGEKALALSMSRLREARGFEAARRQNACVSPASGLPRRGRALRCRTECDGQ